MSDERPMIVQQPYVIIFKPAGSEEIAIRLYPHDLGHDGYGLLICDLVRHVAAAFKVDEDDVWEWVEKERRKPTTALSQPS